MAYPQMGNLYPSEAGFRTPGAYEAFLTSEGKTRAAYLAETDAFFAQLAENTRQFNETLGFKNKELASRETLTREGYSLQRELQDEQLDFERWKVNQYVGVENKKITAAGGMNYLGGPSRKDLIDLAQKNFDARYGIKEDTETSSDRFYTVDYSNGGKLRGARPGELSGQVSDYGQGGSPRYASGVSNYTDYNWYDKEA